MEVIGFARDSKQQFVTVVIQPYIIGDLITEDERISFMHGLDFDDAGMDYGMHLNYKTDTLYVGDLNEFNVIKGETGLNVLKHSAVMPNAFTENGLYMFTTILK